MEQIADNPEKWFCHFEGRTAPGGARLNPVMWRWWQIKAKERGTASAFASKVEGVWRMAAEDHDFTLLPGFVPRVEEANRGSVRRFADRLEKHWEYYERAGLTEELPEGTPLWEFLDIVNPIMGAVREPDDGKARICIDHLLNGVMIQESFTMARAQGFSRAGRRTYWRGR